MNVHMSEASSVQLGVGELSIHVTASLERNNGRIVPELTDGELTTRERVKSHPLAMSDVPPVPPAI